jgi:hypothetical protein
MNHQDAMKSMATERYTLDEMKPAERDAFEEHFFDCSICADDVLDSAKFAAGVRPPVPVPMPVPLPVPHRSNWWAVAASVFAVGLGYESLWVMPHIKAGQAKIMSVARLAEPIQLESMSRGTNEEIVRAVRPDEAIPITFSVETDKPEPLYICQVLDDAGKIRASISIPQSEASEPVRVVLPPHTLSSGHYKLVIRGGEREIAAYPFTVEVR